MNIPVLDDAISPLEVQSTIDDLKLDKAGGQDTFCFTSCLDYINHSPIQLRVLYGVLPHGMVSLQVEYVVQER